MPTKRRPRLKQMYATYEELTFNQEYELLHGRSILPSEFGGDIDAIDAMREAWELHREVLLAAWIADHPCTRPFAWWLFEGVPKYGERAITDKRFASEYIREAWLRHGILHTNACHPETLLTVQEPERDYLARQGELTDMERDFLDRRSHLSEAELNLVTDLAGLKVGNQ